MSLDTNQAIIVCELLSVTLVVGFVCGWAYFAGRLSRAEVMIRLLARQAAAAPGSEANGLMVMRSGIGD